MLNERIKELRVANGFSQVDLAEKLGVSKQSVSNLSELQISHIQQVINDIIRD